MFNRSFVPKKRGARFGAALALAALAVPCAAFALDVDPAVATVCRLAGRVIAEAKSEQANGSLQLQSYRVEELRFAPMKVKVRGNEIETDTAWRITITGGPFEVRDIPPVIWVDKEPVGWGQESPELTSVSTIVFDRSLIRDGAELSVSYGESGTRVTVLERLALSKGKGGK